jgi:hypothetical protein
MTQIVFVILVRIKIAVGETLTNLLIEFGTQTERKRIRIATEGLKMQHSATNQPTDFERKKVVAIMKRIKIRRIRNLTETLIKTDLGIGRIRLR